LGTRSILLVPIISKGQVLGSLGLDIIKKTHAFTPEEIDLCEVFAAQVAVAIENARQHEELKKTQGLVGSRTVLAWMGMANSTWRHTIEGYAINIRNSVTMLKQDIQNYSSSSAEKEKMLEWFDLIESQALKILEKPVTPPLASEESNEIVLICDLLRERVAQLKEDHRFHTFTPQLHLSDCDTQVKVSPDWFRRALDILIDNAVDALEEAQAAGDTKEPSLIIASRRTNDQYEIEISNNGHVIPDEIRKKLFIDPIEKPAGAKGFGMGLLMVQAIMQAYRGNAWLEDSSPEATKFVISLPAMLMNAV
jgi:signal transduction histidine kinase